MEDFFLKVWTKNVGAHYTRSTLYPAKCGIWHSFITSFHVNIFILNRSIRIYKIYVSRSVVLLAIYYR